ncbi:5031_t:CDS:2, partial [Cetraspora pellucida]
LTTDNELAMITCGHLLAKELENEFDNIKFSYYRCVAHVLNLVAKQELRMVDSAISKVQQLMAKIKASVCLCNELHTLCEFKGIRYLKAELDMKVSIDNNSIAKLYSNNDDQQKLQ